VPFLSDADAEVALEDAGVTGEAASAIVEENAKSRLDALRISLAVIAVVAATALFFTGPVPTRQPGANAADATRGSPHHDDADT
jgi:hypothetical protein